MDTMPLWKASDARSLKFAVVLVGQVFLTLNRHLHVEVLHAFLEPFRTELMAMLPQEVIDFILMNDATKPRHEEGRHISCAPSQLAFKNLLHVYCLGMAAGRAVRQRLSLCA